jgi:hypothetical protein
VPAIKLAEAEKHIEGHPFVAIRGGLTVIYPRIFEIVTTERVVSF